MTVFSRPSFKAIVSEGAFHVFIHPVYFISFTAWMELINWTELNLSVAVQVIAREDSSFKWLAMCRVKLYPLTTYMDHIRQRIIHKYFYVTRIMLHICGALLNSLNIKKILISPNWRHLEVANLCRQEWCCCHLTNWKDFIYLLSSAKYDAFCRMNCLLLF